MMINDFVATHEKTSNLIIIPFSILSILCTLHIFSSELEAKSTQEGANFTSEVQKITDAASDTECM